MKNKCICDQNWTPTHWKLSFPRKYAEKNLTRDENWQAGYDHGTQPHDNDSIRRPIGVCGHMFGHFHYMPSIEPTSDDEEF